MKPARSQLVLVAVLLSAGVLQFFSNRIDAYVLEVALNVGIAITLAVSLNLINGYTGQFSMGHAGFMSVGAYTAAAVTKYGGPKLLPMLGGSESVSGIALLFLIALLTGGIAAGLAGLLVGAPSLRLRGDYLAIVTLGFGEIIRVIFLNVDSLGGALGLNGIPPYTNSIWTFGVAAVTTYTVVSLVNSSYGRAFIAVHDDEIAAEAMGINTTRYKIIAFVVGSFFAGVAGGLYAHLKQAIDPKGFDFNRSIEIVVMVILGGMGNTAGVILAAVVLTLLPELLRQLPAGLKSFGESRMIIYSLLLIVLMITRPQGLFRFRLPRKRAAKSA